LNWIAVDFDWSRGWPSPNSTLDLANIDHIMSFAAQNGISVLVSITNPPPWASTPAGPDPELTAGLVAQFSRLYPETLKAIELFPAANTERGWGAPPNPAGYIRLFKAVSVILNSASMPADEMTVLVAAGLVPVSSPGAADMDDLDYLQQLYSAGAAEYISILGIRFPALTGDPLTDPRSIDAQVLRHYELIRSVMLENSHSKGLIWVTGFSWPAPQPDGNSSLGSESSLAAMESAQSRWLSNAHQQMKSQLYLGAAFYDCLNPPAAEETRTTYLRCLVQDDQGSAKVHPALSSIGYMNTLLNKQQTQVSNPGPGGLSVPFDIKAAWKSAAP
jgi:hypothetical protein